MPAVCGSMASPLMSWSIMIPLSSSHPGPLGSINAPGVIQGRYGNISTITITSVLSAQTELRADFAAIPDTSIQ